MVLKAFSFSYGYNDMTTNEAILFLTTENPLTAIKVVDRAVHVFFAMSDKPHIFDFPSAEIAKKFKNELTEAFLD